MGQYGSNAGIAARQNLSANMLFYLGLPLNLATIEVLDSLGIITPFGAFVFRPFQSFNMGSAVIMKAGNDTGFTCVGNSDFQLGDSVTNKTHLGHFTFCENFLARSSTKRKDLSPCPFQFSRF